ncbi:MAG: ComF family protein [Eubacteriales bacterium]|nr:ComF family protein [Eubacteriales bacterium]
MVRLLEILLDLLFPRRCPFCGSISDGTCEKCRKKVIQIEHPFCYRCGRPLKREDEELCDDCRKHNHYFCQGRALYPYEKEVRESVYAVKYQNKREYLEYFSQDMAEKFQKEIQSWNPQVLIPIPMHIKARKMRGYNQAEILAEKLGEELDLPVCTRALCKIRHTANQKEMDYRQRRQNLKGAFDIDKKFLDEKGRLPWKRAVLVDDVYTTGSTLDEAAKTLLEHGAEAVYFVTICIVTE